MVCVRSGNSVSAEFNLKEGKRLTPNTAANGWLMRFLSVCRILARCSLGGCMIHP